MAYQIASKSECTAIDKLRKEGVVKESWIVMDERIFVDYHEMLKEG